MLRQAQGARRYNERITLTKAATVIDDYGHVSLGEPVPVLAVYAQVRQMSATKTALTFQQADIVGVEIEFRAVDEAFNGILWDGHQIAFSHRECVDERGRVFRINGYYQIDNPQ